MKTLMLGVIMSLVAVAAAAHAKSPYVGQETSDIKALSPQDIDDYLNGRGLGYAKAAELNHYPGPRHVLDLAHTLALTPEQMRQTRAIFETMQTRAVALGTQLLAKEQALDRQFANGSMDAVSLHALVSEIGVLQANIRYAHLVAHLEQKAVLTEHQVQLYDQLRGYGVVHEGTRPIALSSGTTSACRRPPTAYARTSLQLPAAAQFWRSAAWWRPAVAPTAPGVRE